MNDRPCHCQCLAWSIVCCVIVIGVQVWVVLGFVGGGVYSAKGSMYQAD